MVKKTDGSAPTLGAISMAARDFKDLKGQRGRKKGGKATTKAEDKKILQVFNKLRPPGSEGIQKERGGREKKRERQREIDRESDRERGGERVRGGEGQRERYRRTDTPTEREGEREMHPDSLREKEERQKERKE